MQFAALCQASISLAGAVRGAAREASLPKADVRSVTSAARRRLWPSLASRLEPLRLRVNGRPVGELPDLRSGDRIVVEGGIASLAVVPDWLAPVGLSLAGERLEARASATIP